MKNVFRNFEVSISGELLLEVPTNTGAVIAVSETKCCQLWQFVESVKYLTISALMKSPIRVEMTVRTKSMTVNFTNSCPNIVSQHNFLSLSRSVSFKLRRSSSVMLYCDLLQFSSMLALNWSSVSLSLIVICEDQEVLRLTSVPFHGPSVVVVEVAFAFIFLVGRLRVVVLNVRGVVVSIVVQVLGPLSVVVVVDVYWVLLFKSNTIVVVS